MSAAGDDEVPREARPVALVSLYAQMALIRAFETRVTELYRDSEIPGFVHTSLGQEAVAAVRGGNVIVVPQRRAHADGNGLLAE